MNFSCLSFPGTCLLVAALALAGCPSPVSSSDGGDAVSADAPGLDAPDGSVADASNPDTSPSTGPTLTHDSLEAARDLLAAGMTEVPWSTDGRYRYRVTRAAGAISRTELLLDGRVVVQWDYAATGSTGQYDRDRDGRFDRRLEITTGAVLTDTTMVESFLDAAGTVIERRTTTRTDMTMLHVSIETPDATGTLTESDSFDTTVMQPGTIISVDQGSGAGMCTSTQGTAARDAMFHVIGDELTCLQGHDPGDADCIADILKHDIRLQCATLPGTELAEISMWDTITGGAGSSIDIEVSPNFFAVDGPNQRATLLHELIHICRGMHNLRHISGLGNGDDGALPGGGFGAVATMSDEVYACARLCFPGATRCHCAACLHTNQCDSRCATFLPCAGPSHCTCFVRDVVYKDEATCNVLCPSGIACFSASCQPAFACP